MIKTIINPAKRYEIIKSDILYRNVEWRLLGVNYCNFRVEMRKQLIDCDTQYNYYIALVEQATNAVIAYTPALGLYQARFVCAGINAAAYFVQSAKWSDFWKY